MGRGVVAGVVAFAAVAAAMGPDRTTPGGAATGRIVFVAKRDFADAPTDLWVVNADGSSLRRLTRTVLNETNPVWSPDGHRVAFEASQPYPNHNKRHLMVMNADGSGRRALTQVHEAATFAAWSRDGRRILYSGINAASGKYEVLVMNSDGSRKRRPAKTPLIGGWEPSWAPNGAISYLRSRSDPWGDVIVVGPDGRPRVVARGRFRSPSFSPDGRYLAWQQSGATAGVYISNPDGSKRRRLEGEQHYLGPWSPDGRRLLIRRAEYPRDGLYSVAPSTKREVVLVDSDYVSDPAWSPDGSRVVYQDRFDLWTISVDGGTRRRIANAPGDLVYSSPSWSRAGT